MDKHGAKDMFRYFEKKYPNTDVTYTLYKYIISKLNKKIVDKVLKELKETLIKKVSIILRLKN